MRIKEAVKENYNGLKRPLRFGTILGVAALALAGCGVGANKASAPKKPTSTTSANPSERVNPPTPTSTITTEALPPTSAPVEPSTTTTTTNPKTTTGPTTTAPVTTECTTNELQASIDFASGTAGTIYYNLELRNISPQTCWEQGYPGISLVRANASASESVEQTVQIGAAARRSPGAEPKVMLTPGQFAVAALGVVDTGNFSPAAACQPETSNDLKIYPPNQTEASITAFSVSGCTNPNIQGLSIRPLQASSQR